MRPHIDFMPIDTDFAFKIRKRQYPIIAAYAMTINMSQGQSFNRVCIFLGLVVRSILHTNIYLVHTKKANFFKVFLHKNILLLNMTFLVNLVIL